MALVSTDYCCANFKCSLEFVGALPFVNGQRSGGLIRIADVAKLALPHVKSQ